MRKTNKHYKEVRERWVKCVLDIVNNGIEQSIYLVGYRIGVHQTQMSRLVRYVKTDSEKTEAPTLDMIIDLCLKYNYSCEWVMTGKGSMKIRESEKQRLDRLDKLINRIKVLIED